MNLRRVNIKEKFEIYGKLFVMLLFIIMLLAISSTEGTNLSKARKLIVRDYRDYNLSEFTCGEIYNKTMEGTLFKSTLKKSHMEVDKVMLYYMENCKK